MARLRTPSNVVEYALKSRTEAKGWVFGPQGHRATGRMYNKSHATILRWEERLARQTEHWSSPAPEDSEITLEGDEIYTRVGENLPPQ
jgi:hypothetical protein